VRVASEIHTLRRFDTVYIGPNQPHQLLASGSRKFGFFCIVNSRRDKPRTIIGNR
jgi:quercetin dioxygenase-like cupin family protein